MVFVLTTGDIHVTGLLEATSTVLGVSGDPGAVGALVVVRALENLLRVGELEPIFANKDVGRSSLELVGRDRLGDGFNGRHEDVFESLLVCEGEGCQH